MDLKIYASSMLAGVCVLAAGIFFLLRLNPTRLPKYEKIMRNRFWGMILGAGALIWCVPLAEVVVFDWMVPYLWPAAALIAILSFYYIDFLFGRALAGWFILLACHWPHWGFVTHFPLLGILTLCCYIMGIVGVCIGGKPCWSRDLLRGMASHGYLKYLTLGYFIFFAAVLLYGGIWILIQK